MHFSTALILHYLVLAMGISNNGEVPSLPRFIGNKYDVLVVLNSK